MHLNTSNQEALELGFGDYTCNWGVHICGLYETEKERDAILMGFLHTGDISNDLQMYCPSERSIDDFKDKYSKVYPLESEHLCDNNCFKLFSAKELYYPEGFFSPISMDKGLNVFFTESQKNGKRNIRATAEMVWALDAIPGIKDLMVYESRLNLFIPKKPWISICLYNTAKFSGTMIMKVLQTHPYVINSGIITENPFYQNPINWLKLNAPEYLLN